MAQDGLGSSNKICIDAFIDAMQQQLQGEDPKIAEKLSNPAVRKNFAAFGEAVFRIATVHAQVSSSASDDAAFWSWLGQTASWLEDLADWQAGVSQAFQVWNPAQPNGLAVLRAAVLAVPGPGAPPTAAPDHLRGRIQ